MFSLRKTKVFHKNGIILYEPIFLWCKMCYGIKHLSDKPYIRAHLGGKFEGKFKSLQHYREKQHTDLSWESML